MKLTTSFVLSLVAASASASPVWRRQEPVSSSLLGGLPTPSAAMSSATGSATASGSPDSSPTSTASAAVPAPTGDNGPSSSGPGTTFNDTQILQYALTLEHLEATFYNQSLSKLSTQDFENAGYNASVRNQIYSIGRDEASHVDLLTAALGEQAVPACTYNFSAVTDVASFLTTARVLEGVGVSAYLGASQNLSNASTLETAASVLVVEGQHQSYLISQTNDGGNVIPGAFSTPLDFKQVYSLAAPFIESCPQDLPITAFPALSLTGGASNGSFTPGQQVTVSYNSSNSTSTSSNETYLAIIQGVTGPQFVSLSGNESQVSLPANLTAGQMYAVVTSSNDTVTDDNTLAGPAVGYVNIPLPQAPEATNSTSSSSAPAPTDSVSSTPAAGGAGGAAPTDTASSGAPTPTASGSDSVVSSEPASSMTPSTGTGAPSPTSPTSSLGLDPSLASAASANIPQATGN